MKTIDEFLSEHSDLKMSAALIDSRSDGDSFHREASHYKITLTKGKESFSFEYSAGPGILMGEVFKGSKGLAAAHKATLFTGTGYLTRNDITRALSHNPPRTLFMDDLREKLMAYARKNWSPDIRSIVDCIRCDISGVIDYQTFEQWAYEFGYDADSRKAEKAFKQCQETMAHAARVLGADACRDLVENVEGL